MDKSGYVVGVDGERAKVQLLKHTACGDCGACQLGKENLELQVDAINKIGAKVGDTVELNMETVNVLRAAAIIYVIPLIGLLAGVFAGLKLMGFDDMANGELYALIFGFFIMGICFLFIKLNEKKLHKSERYTSVITKVLLPSGEFTCPK